MTIQKALLSSVEKLRASNIPSANLDAEVLLSHVLKRSKGFLLAHPEKSIAPSQIRKFQSLIAKRQRNIPIAYLINQKEFYGLNFFVDKNVIVPRPETELLIEEAIKIVRHNDQKNPDKRTTIADIGTGTGCIAVTLAKYLPNIKVIATDISSQTLKVAKKNASSHKVISKIKFIKGNLLMPLKRIAKRTPIDIIMANLPYLTRDELHNVPHEPKQALVGGKLGLELIDKLITQLPSILPKNGIVLLEISPTQIPAVEYMVERQLPKRSISFIRDLAGRERVVIIK